MTASKRGVCLIINNYDFSNSIQSLGKREGTMLDEGMFNYFGRLKLKLVHVFHPCYLGMHVVFKVICVSSRVSAQSV